MSCFIVEKGGAGLTVVKSIGKLGYKGVDTAELLFEDFACPAANLVGGVEGRGFGQVMSGLEAGRINIAARAVGVAQGAFEGAAARGAGAPRLDDMAVRVDAARLLTYWGAGMKDRAERCDLEAEMAKLCPSETAQEVGFDAVRLCGTSTALAIERCYRDTPLMIIGEGTNEIQRTIIARQLVERHGERGGGLVSRDGEPEERRRTLLAGRPGVGKSPGPGAARPAGAGPLALTRAAGAGWGPAPASLAGVTVAAAAPDLGVRGAPPAVVSLRGVRLPVRRPSSSAPRLLAVVDLGLGAVAVGLGQAAFEAALRYSQQRSTFGKAICQHQAVQLKLADMATRLTAARLLVGDAAARGAAADDGGAARRARRFAVDAAVAVTLESMPIHGGYGYKPQVSLERH